MTRRLFTTELSQTLPTLTRLTRGVSWYSLGTVFNQGSTFAVNLILANMFGREKYGMFAIVQTTMLNLVQVAQLAMALTTTKYVAELRTRDIDRCGRVLGLCSSVALAGSLTAAVVLMVAAGWVAGSWLHEPALTGTLRLAAGTVLFAALNGYQTAALAGLERFDRVATTGIISGLTYVIFALVGARAFGLDGALGGILGSSIIQWVLLRQALTRELCRRRITVSSRGAREEASILFSFALPAALSGFTAGPAILAASALLARLPNGFDQMALFAAATNMRIAILFLPNTINAVGISLLNNVRGRNDPEAYRRAFCLNMAVIIGTAILGAAGAVAFGPLLLRAFGRDFAPGFPILVILAAAAVAEAVSIAAWQLVQSEGRMWYSFLAIALPRDVLLLILAATLVPHWMAIGLAASCLASQALAALSALWSAWSLGAIPTRSVTRRRGVFAMSVEDAALSEATTRLAAESEGASLPRAQTLPET